MDSQSNEVIRQFPSKEAIEIARALDKLQGLLIKDKA
jgi:flagellar protein FlaG